MKKNIPVRDLSLPRLREYLLENEQKPYRYQQLCNWLYKKYCTDFEEMTTISKSFRSRISEDFLPLSITMAECRQEEETEKYLFYTRDNLSFESVLIRDQQRVTLCISSQIGCSLQCAFCRTGQIPLQRNLTQAEILEQYALVNRLIKPEEHITNIVFMGMGEPLLNYDNVVGALKIFLAEEGFCVSGRRITVSTAGIIPALEKLGREQLGIQPAISLNAPEDKLRSRLMPVNKTYPLEKLVQTANNYPLAPRRRLTFEYVLLKGINDSLDHARKLVHLIRPTRAKVNLIPLNYYPGCTFTTPTLDSVLCFEQYLRDNHISAFIRKSKGQDVSAACGQLAADYLQTS